MRQAFHNSKDLKGRDQIRLKIYRLNENASLYLYDILTHMCMSGGEGVGGRLGGQQCIPTVHCFETTPPPSPAKMHTRACAHTHTRCSVVPYPPNGGIIKATWPMTFSWQG